MAISKAQQAAVAKYNAANYDRIEVKVSKGQKSIISEHAKCRGESLNAFINRAIQTQMQCDKEAAE